MTSGATIAVRTIAITSAAPRSPWAVRKRLIFVLRKPDSRIEDHVEQINREVGEHDDGRDDENRRLDQGNIAVEQSLIGQPAHAGVVEQRLNDDDRAKEVTNLKAGPGDPRADRVGQRVAPNDCPLPETFRASDANEFLSENSGHGRSGHAREMRHEAEPESQRRKERVSQSLLETH